MIKTQVVHPAPADQPPGLVLDAFGCCLLDAPKRTINVAGAFRPVGARAFDLSLTQARSACRLGCRGLAAAGLQT